MLSLNILQHQHPDEFYLTGGAASEKFANYISASSFRHFCCAPVRGDITSLKAQNRETRKIGDISYAFEYFRVMYEKGERPTLFLHGIDRINETLAEKAYEFSPDQFWRFSNVSASLSSSRSSIGFHADIMDVVICQIEGARQWSIWDKARMDRDYVRSLEKGMMVPAPVCQMESDRIFHLQENDELFIPAHWGHEGVTSSDEHSVSLSFSWISFTPYMFLFKLLKADPDFYSFIPTKEYFETYSTSSFDKGHLVDYLLELLSRSNMKASRSSVLASIDFSLTNLT